MWAHLDSHREDSSSRFGSSCLVGVHISSCVMAGSERGPTREQMRRLLGLDLFGSVDFTYGLTCSFFAVENIHLESFEDLAFDLAPCNQVDVWPGSTRQRTCLPRPLHYIILCVCHRRNAVAFFCLWKCFLTIHASVFRTVELCRT